MPISHFQVGAAAYTSKGRIFLGTNIEIAYSAINHVFSINLIKYRQSMQNSVLFLICFYIHMIVMMSILLFLLVFIVECI